MVLWNNTPNNIPWFIASMELLFSQYFPSCGSRYICYPRPTRQSILGVNNNSPLDWARQNISQTDFAVVVVRRALSLHYIYIVFSNTHNHHLIIHYQLSKLEKCQQVDFYRGITHLKHILISYTYSRIPSWASSLA